MPKANVALHAFNRGIISPLALARTDLDRLRLSAETQTNFMPRTLGSMMLRPGLEYKGARKSNGQSVSLPFIFAADDMAEIELTGSVMRVWVDDALIERPAVTASVTNGDFTSDVTNWTDRDESGATSQWVAGGYLSLQGNGTAEARRSQEVAVNETNTLHALRIVIERGPVELRMGTTAGDDSYISATLKTGTHSIAFTPAGNFFVEFASAKKYSVLVDSVAVESSGTLELPTPWGSSDLAKLRWDQSADVVFLACEGYQQRRIERRTDNSWSVVLFEPQDGPFGLINVTPISLTPSAITGDITLTASGNFFEASMVGELFKITSAGQLVQATASAENTFTNSVLVTGVGPSRVFSYSVTGTWSGTVTLQRSVDDATWEDVITIASNTSTTFDDKLDNVPYYYRLGIKTGEYTSGSAGLSISYSGGSLTGIAKVTSYTSATQVGCIVLQDLGGTDATRDWYRSQWSEKLGWPTATALYEGRLWFAGKSGIWGSVSDGYESFDNDEAGDAGPINRVIGQGPVDYINWLAPVQRLIMGSTLSEISCRSTSFDEPLTPTNFNLKNADTQGSAAIPPVMDGTRVVYVQRSKNKIYQLQYDIQNNDYGAVDLSELAPEVGLPSITRVAIQRQPDTRIHCVRADGKVAILVKDDAESTLAWTLFETEGEVEDVYVFPGDVEDSVYYTVKRTINGSAVRYREKWALESEGEGGTSNKLADSFYYYSGAATTTITGLSHLEGEEVVVWGNGKDLGTKTVSGGQITGLSESVTTACVGLPYTAQYKSTKLAYASGMGTALNQKKKLDQFGIVAQNLHHEGLQYGPTFDELWDLPQVKDFQDVADDTVYSSFDEETFPGGGHWTTDARLCLQAQAPRPCTLLACVMGIATHDKD